MWLLVQSRRSISSDSAFSFVRVLSGFASRIHSGRVTTCSSYSTLHSTVDSNTVSCRKTHQQRCTIPRVCVTICGTSRHCFARSASRFFLISHEFTFISKQKLSPCSLPMKIIRFLEMNWELNPTQMMMWKIRNTCKGVRQQKRQKQQI